MESILLVIVLMAPLCIAALCVVALVEIYNADSPGLILNRVRIWWRYRKLRRLARRA